MFADVIISSPLVSAGFLLVHAIDRTSENINFAPGSSLGPVLNYTIPKHLIA